MVLNQVKYILRTLQAWRFINLSSFRLIFLQDISLWETDCDFWQSQHVTCHGKILMQNFAVLWSVRQNFMTAKREEMSRPMLNTNDHVAI